MKANGLTNLICSINTYQFIL